MYGLGKEKKGGGEGFTHAEGGGGTKGFEVVSTQELEFLAIVVGRGSVQSVPPSPVPYGV